MDELKNKRIITVALTGPVAGKNANPNIPLSPEEIAEDAYNCWKAGAAMVHLHMRDENGRPACDVDKFEKTQRLIQERCDVIVNMTTTGFANTETRLAPIVKCRPEVCSYDAGSFNWMTNPPWLFSNPPEFLSALNKVCEEYEVKPEFEIFNAGMIDVTKYYIRKGELKTPCHFQFVMGVPGGLEATVENLVFLVNKIPEGSTWSAFGISHSNVSMMYAALARGGHVRVGLEDALYYSKGVLASNVMLVERAARAIRELNCEVATPDEARRILGTRGAKA